MNQVRYARSGGSSATVVDAASRDRFTEGVFLAYVDEELPHADQDDADDWAQLNLLAGGAPEFTIAELGFDVTGDPYQLALLVGLDISDRVEVTYTPQTTSGAPIVRSAWVAGIAWTVTAAGVARCTLTLASASRYNFLRFGDSDATLDIAGFAPGLTPVFTGGRYVAVAGELVVVDDWQAMADQCVYRFDDLAQLGDEFPDPQVGAFVYRADRGFVFFNGTTWLRPTG
jgi:hypothetical protein